MKKSTKITLILTILAIFIAGITVTTLAFRGRGFGPRGFGIGRRLNYLRHHPNQRLRLKPAQEKKIDRLFANHVSKMIILRRELFRLWDARANESKIRAKEKQIEALTDKFLKQIKSVLTPAQRKEFNNSTGYYGRRGYGRRGYGPNGYCPGPGYGRGYGRRFGGRGPGFHRGYGPHHGRRHGFGPGYGRGYGRRRW